jgi:uncharacterized RDD family membrane protein YckC
MSGNEEETRSPSPSLPTRRDPRAGRRPEEVAAGLAVFGARLGMRAGRVAILPFRVAGRIAGPTRVERVTGGLGADGRAVTARSRTIVETAVERTLDGPLPDTVAQLIVDHRLVERIVADVMTQIDLEATLTQVLDDERTQEQLQRVLASPALERLVVSAVESKLVGEAADRLLGSEQVRAALRRQTGSMAEQLVDEIRDRASQVDDRISVGTPPPGEVRYGGIVTRAIALTVDALLANLAVLVPAALIALIASLAGGLHSSWLADSLLGAGWFVVVAAYFIFFWTVIGQTPGMYLMGVRVTNARGDRPSFLRSAVRLVGLILSIFILFAGFLPVLFDSKRRGLADFLAGTVVRIAR